MLEMIKQCIQDMPDVPFPKLFMDYMMEVQDANIGREIQVSVKQCRSVLEIEKIVSLEVDAYNENNNKKIKSIV